MQVLNNNEVSLVSGADVGDHSEYNYGGFGSARPHEPGLGFVMPSPVTYAFIFGRWVGWKIGGSPTVPK